MRRAERHLELNPNDPRALSMCACALGTDGQRERALSLSARVLELYPDEPGVLISVACLYLDLAMKEEALGILEQLFASGCGKRDWIENDPDYDPLREDPRFQALLEKLH